MPTLPSALTSADCQHVAFQCYHGTQWSVFYDGQEGHRYLRVHSLTFSASGAHFAYVGDDTRSNAVLVLDGKEGPAYNMIAPESLKFSPDGGRLAYVIGFPCTNSVMFDAHNRWVPSRVVVDGKESRNYLGLVTRGLLFSPDGNHLAYKASLEEVLTANHVSLSVIVRDGVDSQPYQAILQGTWVFSPDSQHLAFVGKRGGKCFVILDGQESPPHDEVESDTVMFTPDSQRLVYRARRGENWFLVVGGKELMRDKDGDPRRAAFSPNTQRMALLVKRDSSDHWLLDGKLGPPFDGVTALLFSPDSQRTFYVGQRANQWHAVVDGVEGPGCERVADTPENFSADSKHVAYLCGRDNKFRLVLDGKLGPEYDWAGAVPVFSKNGKHVAFAASRGSVPSDGRQPEGTWIVVDGRESKPYSRILNLAFVDNNTVRAIALRFNDQTMEPELVRVELEIPES
jgi:hypothetical protein